MDATAIDEAIEAVGAAAAHLGADHASTGVSQAHVSALLAAAVRLYTACSEDPYSEAALAALEVTPTEACTAATALLHSQSLTPFEFSIWFSGSRVR